MKKGLGVVVAAAALAGCGRSHRRPPAAALPAAVAPAQTPARRGPDPAAQRELSDAVETFILTDRIVDAVAACDSELRDFWANPAEAAKIRAQLTMGAILKAIEETPRVKQTLDKHNISPRDYLLGTFAMLGGYSYLSAKAANPKLVEGKKPPVSAATLQVIEKRRADVEKIVRPGGPQASPSPPAAAAGAAGGLAPLPHSPLPR